MILADLELRIHTVPDSPWTGLMYGDWWFCNSVEHADWRSDPVAPWTCWDCEQAWCCQHGLARVVTTDCDLLWMAPYFSTQDLNPFSQLRPEQFIDRGALIPRKTWDMLADDIPGMPRSQAFPRMTSHNLIHLSDERVKQLAEKLQALPELEFASSFVVTCQARVLIPGVD
ncbi:MAG: hypothetical protein KDA96_11625 [Planctomycetaceae bacterium]|nr:hypothetical protein [Planctomycetaceae bacterium]